MTINYEDTPIQVDGQFTSDRVRAANASRHHEYPGGALMLPDDWKCGCICSLATEQPGFEVLGIEDLRRIADARGGANWTDDFVSHIFSQTNVGSCTPEAYAQGVCVTRAFQDPRGPRDPQHTPNPWTVYCRATNVDRGSGLGDIGRRYATHGAVSMASWPRVGPDAHGWRDRPPDDLYEREGSVLKIGKLLEAPSRDAWLTGIVVHGMVGIAGRAKHCLCYLKMFPNGDLEYANSWSKRWTNEDRPGFGREPHDRTEARYGRFLIKSVVDDVIT